MALKITYGTYTLYNGGSESRFIFAYGVRPSWGYAWLRAEDVAAIIDGGGGAENIVFNDGTEDVLTLTDWYLAKSERATTSTPADNDLCKVFFTDERILWQRKYAIANYNTYKKDRSVGSAGDFTLDNINGAAPWTFAEILVVLNTLLGTTITLDATDYSALTRTPRNIVGLNYSGACVLQQLLNQLQGWLSYNYTDGTATIYRIGSAEQAADTTPFTTYAKNHFKAETITFNPAAQHAATAKYRSAGDIDTLSLINQLYGTQAIAGGLNDHHINGAYAIYQNDENAAILTTVGNEVATEYATSFANVWRDSLYGGIIPFTLNRASHEITWLWGRGCATTRVRSFRPREEELEEIKDTLYTYGQYLMGGGGGGTVAYNWGKVVVGLVYGVVGSGGINEYILHPVSINEATVYPAWSSGGGTADAHDNYAVGDKVKGSDTRWYICIVQGGASPAGSGAVDPATEDPDVYWELDTGELSVTRAIGYEIGNEDAEDIRNYIPWYPIDSFVPYISSNVDGTTRTYILLGMTYTGPEDFCSLRYNEEEKRSMAVWK